MKQPTATTKKMINQFLVLFSVVLLILPLSFSFTLNSFRRANSLSFTSLKAATGIPLDNKATQFTAPAKEEAPNLGVLLLNLGGPETGDDVEGKAIQGFRSTVQLFRHVSRCFVLQKVSIPTQFLVCITLKPFQDFYSICLRILISSDCQVCFLHCKRLSQLVFQKGEPPKVEPRMKA